mmetsp:Transcript_25167/g.32831  ORF Transcript_25167/g.32831 Transcript_25167/m.32831 type:complete len:301 (-) Transcript_25167:247-1149(-)
MSAARKKQENISQALIRLEQKIAEKDFYEALQIYDFIFKRYNSQNEEDKADDIAKAGALLFIENNEFSNAVRMSVLMIESFEKREEIKEQEMAAVKEIVNALWGKVGSEGDSKPLVDILKAAVRWSSHGEVSGRGGDEELNAKLGAAYGRWGDYADACRHYANSAPVSMPEYALLLKEYAALGYVTEAPMFAARAVLHLLAMKKAESAAALCDQLASWNLDAPIWNFASFVNKLAQMPGEGETYAAAFKLLQDRYRASLERDYELVKYVYKIGKIYFNVQPPAGAEDNDLFGNIMKMLTA